MAGTETSDFGNGMMAEKVIEVEHFSHYMGVKMGALLKEWLLVEELLSMRYQSTPAFVLIIIKGISDHCCAFSLLRGMNLIYYIILKISY